jgi:hypothetical protein
VGVLWTRMVAWMAEGPEYLEAGVTRLRITDKTPCATPEGWRWECGSSWGDRDSPATLCMLPPLVWDCLPQGTQGPHLWATSEEAHEALSMACFAWARKRGSTSAGPEGGKVEDGGISRERRASLVDNVLGWVRRAWR